LSITSPLPGGVLLSAGEVAFREDVATVSEPTTLALMMIMIILAGLGYGRKRTSAKTENGATGTGCQSAFSFDPGLRNSQHHCVV